MPINSIRWDGKPVSYLNEYQQIATGTAIYPGSQSPFGLAYVALKMNGEAGEFAEHVGKAMRDDGLLGDAVPSRGVPARYPQLGELTPERRLALIKECGDVLWYVAAACTELGISLAEAATTNIQKLYDRQARGTLGGSGDNR